MNRKSQAFWAQSLVRHFILCLGLTGSFMLSSCGSEPASRLGSDDAAGVHGRDKIVEPPKAYYASLLAERMQLAQSGAFFAPQQQVLFVNFAGASVKQGYSKTQSFLPCKDSVSIPASGLSLPDQEAVLNKVAEYFSNAGVNLKVTPQLPTSGDFTTVHVGGSYANLGCPGGASVAGIAPFDVANANPNDIAFVFMGSRDLETIAQTIAHEAAHSFGLDHTDNKADIMYPTSSSQVLGFAKGIAYSSGQPQDAAALLQAALGQGAATISGKPVLPTLPVPSIVAPSAPIIKPLPNLAGILPSLPGLGALGGFNNLLGSFPGTLFTALNCVLPGVQPNIFQGGLSLPNAQGALSLLTLLQNASMAQNGMQLNMTNILTLVIAIQTMNVPQLVAMAGIAVNTNQCLNQLIPVNISGITTTLPGQLPTTINVAQIMGMTNISNPGQLISLLPQYAQVISANSQGANAQILMSIVMMAMAQQYNGLIPIAP